MQDRLVEQRWAGVHKELAALRCLHNTAEVSSIDPLNHRSRVLTEKGAGTDEITVAAQYLMTLANQEYSQQRPRRPDTKNKDPHEVETVAQLYANVDSPDQLP